MTIEEIITTEEILILAEQYMDVFPDDYTATKEQLIAFAHRIAFIAYDLGSMMNVVVINECEDEE